MSIDKSLRRKNTLQRARNVLTRGERILQMKKEDRWPDGRSPYGLPKVKVIKIVVKKVKKAGLVKIGWRGTIHGRKLRAGRYVVEVSMEDNVGNVTDSPPFQAIHIVRTR